MSPRVKMSLHVRLRYEILVALGAVQMVGLLVRLDIGLRKTELMDS